MTDFAIFKHPTDDTASLLLDKLMASDKALVGLLNELENNTDLMLSDVELRAHLLWVYRQRTVQLLSGENLRRMEALARHFDDVIKVLGASHVFAEALAELDILLGLRILALMKGLTKALLEDHLAKWILLALPRNPRALLPDSRDKTVAQLCVTMCLQLEAGNLALITHKIGLLEQEGLVVRTFDRQGQARVELSFKGQYFVNGGK